jgi:hypothetical protein
MSNPPEISNEARRAALEKAANYRRERAAFKRDIAEGKRGWREAIESQSEAISRMRVKELLESMPGFGSIRAQAILERVGISTTRRIKGLGSTQRKKLEEELMGR